MPNIYKSNLKGVAAPLSAGTQWHVLASEDSTGEQYNKHPTLDVFLVFLLRLWLGLQAVIDSQGVYVIMPREACLSGLCKRSQRGSGQQQHETPRRCALYWSKWQQKEEEGEAKGEGHGTNDWGIEQKFYSTSWVAQQCTLAQIQHSSGPRPLVALHKKWPHRERCCSRTWPSRQPQ
jgi:hypothetical protein